jgi:ATP/maltotriose-dependent transcriptional regulator MalT
VAIHLTSAFVSSRIGRYREANAQVDTALRRARDAGDRGGEADGYLLQATIALERRQLAAAIDGARRVEELVARAGDGVITFRQRALAQLIAGIADAQAGRLDSARRRRIVQHEADGIQRAWHEALQGEVALAAGDAARAETAFRAAVYSATPSFGTHPATAVLINNPPFRDGLARAIAAGGELAAARALYARLTDVDVTAKVASMIEPRFVLAQARLADRAGDRATAQAAYARFLALWKNSDAGSPEVAEARRRSLVAQSTKRAQVP